MSGIGSSVCDEPSAYALRFRSETRRALRGQRHRVIGDFMANILVCVFAVALCLVNALVWTFVSELPVVGVGWVGAAALCFRLQKWSKA